VKGGDTGARGAPRVGLIVNPFAGRDVRRFVAPAGSLSNYERSAMVRRLLAGLRASGVREVLYMPEDYGIVGGAAADSPGIAVAPALARGDDSPGESTRAARAMTAAGVGVIVTLGGDGTNRLVAAGAGETPLLPIPAGTNNAFAEPVEATVAGVAAGLIARLGRRGAARARCVRRRKRIVVSVDGRSDLALVDAVITTDLAVAGRAVWDPRHVIALMVTHAEPGVLGLSGLVAAVRPVGVLDPRGAYVELGAGTPVGVLLAPGIITPTEIRSVRDMPVGSSVLAGPATGTVSLDGERTFEVREDAVRMTLEAGGPWVVDVRRTLRWAQRSGFFLTGLAGAGRT
jgi:hypothetical protein